MSLPWRFTSVDRYVVGTIQRIEMKSPTYKSLNVGRYYLSQQNPSELTEEHLQDIFVAALQNPYLDEITVCGLDLKPNGIAIQSLLQLLLSSNHTWKRIMILSCTNNNAILALSNTASMQIPTLKEIRIENCLPLSITETISLQKNLTLNPHLTHLEISKMDFLSINPHDNSSNNIMLPLALGIASTKTLEVLELSYCRFDLDTMQCLAMHGLQKNTSIKSILLPGCELEDEIIATLVSEGLTNHPTLEHLKLFRNHCGDMGVHAIARLLETPTQQLQSLDLSYQQFERSKKLNIGVLSTALQRNTSLQTLALSFNKLNDKDVLCLAKGLHNNQTMIELDLRANNIRDSGVMALAKEIVSRSEVLQKFCLYGNPISEDGGNSLLKAIEKNTEIVMMNMDYNLTAYDKIHYYVYLNQVGRRLLKEDTVSSALWTRIFHRAKQFSSETRGVCTEADLIYPFIRDPLFFNQLRR